MLKLRKIGIIGAGTMGSGIAQKIAQEGFDVLLNDVSKDALTKAMGKIHETLQEGVERKIFTEDKVKQIISYIQTSSNLAAVADCQLVIEAVFENMAAKKEVLNKLDEICPPETIFATNTSTLSVEELALVTKRPHRFVGLHFFFPPARNNLLEIIFTKNTCQEAIDVVYSLSNLMGKTPIIAADAPGFAVNRYFIPLANEAVRLLDEGVADIPSIDHVFKEMFQIGVGPFSFMNATDGITLAYRTTTIMSQRISKFYGPAAGIQAKFKSGEQWDLSGDPTPDMFQKIRDRLLGVVFLLAASLVDEGVATIDDIDIGAKIGLRWKFGPFEMMNQLGIDKSYYLAKSIAYRNSDLKIPTNLEEQRRKREPWDIHNVSLIKRGPIAYITIMRPETMNALNETIISQLDQCIDEVESDPDIITVIIGSLGKAFVVGADINFFIDRIKVNRIEDIEKYGERGNEILNRIEDSKKLMIARVQGFALGGGLELALACHSIVASNKATFGLPETSIGICPGFGGTQRTIRKIGKPLAKYMVLTGQALDAVTALRIGLVEYVIPIAELDYQITQISSDPFILTKKSKPRPKLTDDLLRIEELFHDSNIERMLSEKEIEKNDLAGRLARAISANAPLAIKTANIIMDLGEKLPLKEALELERKYVRDIFRTNDALEGLISVGKEKPQFKGK